jgi:hypothetical protein
MVNLLALQQFMHPHAIYTEEISGTLYHKLNPNICCLGVS